MINLQDAILNRLRKEHIPVTVFLTNGFQLRGCVRAFDSFTVVLDVDGRQNIVYKHAISTLIPQHNIELTSLYEQNA